MSTSCHIDIHLNPSFPVFSFYTSYCSAYFCKAMADLGALITIADKVFQLLQSQVLKDMKDWKSDLGKLNKSVSFIKNMLLDADTKPELSHGEQAWVEELKEVLYEADDLFDEVITMAKVKELDAGAKFSKKVLDNVGSVSSTSTGKQFGGQLKDLKFLVNLRGEIDIIISGPLASEEEVVQEDGYLEQIKNLKVVRIYLSFRAHELNHEALIVKLQPNRNLMQFSLSEYEGTEIPMWGRAEDDWAIILPNLVKINLKICERLHGIPLLSNLKHLKSLSLYHLCSLEYMETSAISRGSSGSMELPFFPSLEYLRLWSLERLKGWWRGVGEGDSSSGRLHFKPPFPRLSTLIIDSCPKLTSLPPCPSLESLQVRHCNKSLRIFPGEGPANLGLKIRVEDIDDVGYLTTLPACRFSHIKIKNDQGLKRLSEIDEVFKNSSSLQSLEINGCTRLASVSGAWEHLTALESLSLIDIPAVVDYSDMPWSSLCHIRSLELKSLDTLQFLPRGMRHLTALQNLSISYCNSLRELSEWISCLSSLQSLIIHSCPNLNSPGTIQYITSLKELEISVCRKLTEACQEPSGNEWPKIRHIPQINISDTRIYK